MRNTRLYITACVMATIGGCSSNSDSNIYPVTYLSDPEGATLYCHPFSTGRTKLNDLDTIRYKINEEARMRGVIDITPCEVEWMSGAVAKADSKININQFPNGFVFILHRPDEPNAQIDYTYALQVKQNRQINQLLQNTQAIQAEQERIKQQKIFEDNNKQQENNTQYLCNLGLLNNPGCK